MTTITIGANTYTVYQSVAEIDVYADAAIGDDADAWRAADEDTKARAGVTATRTLDRQSWQGEKTDESQELAFPRTGLTDADGNAVASDTVPDQVLQANSELALALIGGQPVQNDPASNGLTRKLKAGSAEIEYFRAITTAARFPGPVQELIGIWLGGGSASLYSGSDATGVDGCTAFGKDNNYDLIRGF